MTSAPWDFGQARRNLHAASQRQEAAEQTLREAYIQAAEADRTYRRALSQKILELKAEGHAITACSEIARGDEVVSDFRYHRDVAEGMREAAAQACWRMTADRKDAQRFADWSQRREMAETGHSPLGET